MKCCSIHQALDKNGLPMASGSEVRLPDGSVIPWVTSVQCKAVAGETYWETTLTMRAIFGEPIAAAQHDASSVTYQAGRGDELEEVS